uniref:Uncharacterized protein n=1 Tax=Arundo donax TaxID=35708 RepID=A0A0A9CV64_ARUDO
MFLGTGSEIYGCAIFTGSVQYNHLAGSAPEQLVTTFLSKWNMLWETIYRPGNTKKASGSTHCLAPCFFYPEL